MKMAILLHAYGHTCAYALCVCVLIHKIKSDSAVPCIYTFPQSHTHTQMYVIRKSYINTLPSSVNSFLLLLHIMHLNFCSTKDETIDERTKKHETASVFAVAMNRSGQIIYC